MTIQLTKELYESPMKERNEEKYGHLNEQCICCFKPMNTGPKLYVHMNTKWEAVNPNIVTDENCEELTGYASQGCFPIGNDCAKKMKGFVFLIED